MERRAGIAAVEIAGERARRGEQQNSGEKCFHRRAPDHLHEAGKYAYSRNPTVPDRA
jgi:hypothetical protein